MKERLFDQIKKKYKVKPEYPWKKYPDYAVLRHADNNKWFALVAEVESAKLGLSGDEYVPIVNLKVDDMMFRDMLIQEDGIMPAYHMMKNLFHASFPGIVKTGHSRLFTIIAISFIFEDSKKNYYYRDLPEW
ncbi:MAG: MmcQ/YjbR family DNA-binding protein, partial [Lachnospiraceae bacterium]|nr:MmcQ/YjbR family DNA-binding protein [Lachnospiraceae bacterium]